MNALENISAFNAIALFLSLVYLYKSLNDMGEISFEFIGFYDLVTHLRNNFKVQKILEKFSYSQILEKMGK